MSAWNLWNTQVYAKWKQNDLCWKTFWFCILKLVRRNATTTEKKKMVEYSQDIFQPAVWLLMRTVLARNIFFFSQSWLVKKVKNVDLLLYISPFLFYNFVSSTCTLEVALHSVAFFLFRLCFKYNVISKTMPYVYFPHFRIRNIFSLVVITQTFGQQRQSTDWESGVRRDADLKKKKKHRWMINYLELLEENSSFKERTRHKTSVFPLLLK